MQVNFRFYKIQLKLFYIHYYIIINCIIRFSLYQLYDIIGTYLIVLQFILNIKDVIKFFFKRIFLYSLHNILNNSTFYL